MKHLLALVHFEILRFIRRNMATLYILQNQHGYFLQKKSADKISKSSHIWGDGQELNKVFRTTYKDEAINMMFEAGSQDVALRISIKEYPANAKGLPTIPTDDLPAPLPKVVSEFNHVDESTETNATIAVDSRTENEDPSKENTKQESAIGHNN
jgi:hypothetical protein